MTTTATQVDPPVASPADEAHLAALLKLSVPIVVKLGERKMRMAEVLRLSQGAIVEFEKPADEPLELMVNNVPIGQGEVVKVGENFGLRVSRIGPPEQTIRALGR